MVKLKQSLILIITFKRGIWNLIDIRINHLYYKDLIYLNELKNGLLSVIPEKAIKIFNSNELELLINGRPFIDVSDWEANTVYNGVFSGIHQVNLFFNNLQFSW